MTISRAAAQTVAQLLTRIRREVGDPSTDAAGNLIPTAARRHQDHEIIETLNDELIKLGNLMAIQHGGEALVHADLIYTESADNEGDGLPAGVNAEGIALVTDISDPTSPIEIFWLNARDLETQVPVSDTYRVQIARRFYTLRADPATNDYRIVVRPNAASLAIRVHYVATPFIVAASGDAPLLSARWREVIGLGAAIRLMSVDEEVPDQLAGRYAEQMGIFSRFASRQKNPERVRMLRRLY
jgi:hypothetical protein